MRGFEAKVLARLDQLAAPSDEQRLLIAISIASHGNLFTVAELIEHGRVNPNFAAMLGDEPNARLIGRVLSRHVGQPGIVDVKNVARENGSFVWRTVIRKQTPSQLPEQISTPEDQASTNED
jgi:alkylated DNA nucleotide flippase Atl1